MATAVLDETRMAKKRTEPAREEPKSLHPAYLRRGTHTPKELREGAARLRHLAAELDGLASQCEGMGVESLKVDGTTKLDRGESLVSDFLKAVEQSIVSEKWRQRG